VPAAEASSLSETRAVSVSVAGSTETGTTLGEFRRDGYPFKFRPIHERRNSGTRAENDCRLFRQCPNCEAVFFFNEDSLRPQIKTAMKAAGALRRALRDEADDKAVNARRLFLGRATRRWPISPRTAVLIVTERNRLRRCVTARTGWDQYVQVRPGVDHSLESLSRDPAAAVHSRKTPIDYSS
jgi:hypothetical protein